VFALFEFLDDLRTESRQILRGAARYEPLVDNNFLVDPDATSVLNVLANCRIRCHRPAIQDVCFDEKPRCVTDDAHGFCLLEECVHEGDRRLVGSQLVGAHASARNDEAVELVSRNITDRLVNGIAAPGVEVVVVRLGLAAFKADDSDRGTGCLDRVFRLLELGLFSAARSDKNGDFFCLEGSSCFLTFLDVEER